MQKSMDQEAEAMKTKKILWPWAERQIKGKKKTSGQPVFGSANMVQDNTGNEVFDNTEIPYDSRPIEISEWFHTFMCMNMPIVGWFYLFHKARYEEDPARKEFARACLFYKLVFLIAGAVVLLILIWIGLGLLDQLLAYMEML